MRAWADVHQTQTEGCVQGCGILCTSSYIRCCGSASSSSEARRLVVAQIGWGSLTEMLDTSPRRLSRCYVEYCRNAGRKPWYLCRLPFSATLIELGMQRFKCASCRRARQTGTPYKVLRWASLRALRCSLCVRLCVEGPTAEGEGTEPLKGRVLSSLHIEFRGTI